MFDIIKAVIIGIVEGLTEFLPISSTGHIDLVDQVVKLSQGRQFMNMFEYVIQFGAILAVILLYFNKLNPFSKPTVQAQKILGSYGPKSSLRCCHLSLSAYRSMTGWTNIYIHHSLSQRL